MAEEKKRRNKKTNDALPGVGAGVCGFHLDVGFVNQIFFFPGKNPVKRPKTKKKRKPLKPGKTR